MRLVTDDLPVYDTAVLAFSRQIFLRSLSFLLLGPLSASSPCSPETHYILRMCANEEITLIGLQEKESILMQRSDAYEVVRVKWLWMIGRERRRRGFEPWFYIMAEAKVATKQSDDSLPKGIINRSRNCSRQRRCVSGKEEC